MLRFLGGAGSALLLVLAGFLIWQSRAERDQPIPPAPPRQQPDGEALPPVPVPLRQPRMARPPEAPERTKEERRFDRADRDNDGRITREEMLQPRRRAYDRLDRNRDGRLSFEEWAFRTVEKFSRADADRNGALNRIEYATTRPQPRNRRPRQNCAC